MQHEAFEPPGVALLVRGEHDQAISALLLAPSRQLVVALLNEQLDDLPEDYREALRRWWDTNPAAKQLRERRDAGEMRVEELEVLERTGEDHNGSRYRMVWSVNRAVRLMMEVTRLGTVRFAWDDLAAKSQRLELRFAAEELPINPDGSREVG